MPLIYRPDSSSVQRKSTPDYSVGDNTFIAVGGEEGIRQLVDNFYSHMDTLPEARTIRAMHAEDLTESKAKLTAFLTGWMGGPDRYTEQYGMMNLPGAHRHLGIGIAEKEAWLLCMQKALDDQNYHELLKRHIMVQLSFPAEMCRSRS